MLVATPSGTGLGNGTRVGLNHRRAGDAGCGRCLLRPRLGLTFGARLAPREAGDSYWLPLLDWAHGAAELLVMSYYGTPACGTYSDALIGRSNASARRWCLAGALLGAGGRAGGSVPDDSYALSGRSRCAGSVLVLWLARTRDSG